MMKKLLALLLTASLCAATLCACQSESASSSGSGFLKTNDCMELWLLNDGNASTTAASGNESVAASIEYGVWLPNATFGTVLDFSTEGSFAKAEGTKVDLTEDFTLSAFIMTPTREDNDRVILSMGKNILWYLSASDNFSLTLEAKGLTGLESSGVSLTDGKWHHVMTTKKGNTVTYYVDGEAVKTCEVSGTVEMSTQDVTLGANRKGDDGLDGSLAEVAVIKGAKVPSSVTATVINLTDNEQKDTRVSLKHGVVIDRPQYFENLIPLSYTDKSDIENCINMGFDHVKLQLVPEWMMAEDGSLIEENMEYICSVLDMVEELSYTALLCVSPCASGINYNFKTKYLGSLQNFELLVKWYGELGAFLREKGYSADHVAIQIMTEPYDNTSAVSWTWMSDRLWGALRNQLPDFTIVTSADKSGNMERIKAMSPTSDWNLVYSFTTYEPYTIGWSSAFTSQVGNETFWNYVGEIPYPIEEGVDYTDAIEEAIKNVPEKYKSAARSGLQSYVAGLTDGGDPYWKNYYSGMLYNREWHMSRAKSLDDWSNQYGGNIHLMCVEFGCYDSQYATVRFGSTGSGTSDTLRLAFIKDLRESFDAYNIGWSYWCYNEGFTVFDTTYHMQYVAGSPSVEEAVALTDYDLLTDSLGLTPKITLPDGLSHAKGAWELNSEELTSAFSGIPGGTFSENVTFATDDTFGTVPVFGNGYALINTPGYLPKDSFSVFSYVKTTGSGTIVSSGEQFLEKENGVYNYLSIHNFNELHNVWGSSVTPDTDCVEGTGCFAATAEKATDLVFAWQLPELDLSSYLKKGANGALHLSVYVSDASKITGGQFELTSSSGPNDSNEHSWDLGRISWKNGWNDITLSESTLLSAKTDITKLHSIRIYFNVSGAVTIKLDDLYAYNTAMAAASDYWKLFVDENGALSFSANGLTGLQSSGKNIADGAWHAVLVSCDNGTFTYYVDGEAVKMLSVSGSVAVSSSADLILGASVDGSSSLPGSLARVAIYKGEKTPDSVWTKK